MCRSEARRTQRGSTGATHVDTHRHKAMAQQGGCHVPVVSTMRAHREKLLRSVQCQSLEEQFGCGIILRIQN